MENIVNEDNIRQLKDEVRQVLEEASGVPSYILEGAVQVIFDKAETEGRLDKLERLRVSEWISEEYGYNFKLI